MQFHVVQLLQFFCHSCLYFFLLVNSFLYFCTFFLLVDCRLIWGLLEQMVPLVYALRSPNICHKQRDCEKSEKKNTNVPFYFLVGLWIHERSFQKVWEKNVQFYFWWEEINARQEEEFGDVLRSKWDDKGTTHLF